MKTQFSRRTRRSWSPQASIAAVAVVLIILIFMLVRAFAPGAFTALGTPLWGAGAYLSSLTASLSDGVAREARMRGLEAEVEALQNENKRLSARLSDGAEAPDLLGIEAGVVARPPLSPYDMLILDAGTSESVYEGMRVYARGVPIGRILSASAESAKAALYSAPGTESEGWAGENRVPVTLIGAGAGAFRADVPREAGLVVGDTVYLPGAGALPIGTIAAIESHPSAPRSVISIRPAVNLFSLATVRVVASPAP